MTGEVVAAVTAMEELFERLNDLSRAEKLLTLAVPEELGAFRRWLLGQYTSQYKGEPPVPWPQWAAALGLDLTADGAEDVDD